MSTEDIDNKRAQIKSLMNKYPSLYPNGSVENGFSVGLGWLPLIDTLSSILDDVITRLPEEIKGEVYAVQVKEKFGTLRFYLNQSTPFIDGAISLAESISGSICEGCGLPGQCRATSWVKTECDSCFATRMDSYTLKP